MSGGDKDKDGGGDGKNEDLDIFLLALFLQADHVKFCLQKSYIFRRTTYEDLIGPPRKKYFYRRTTSSLVDIFVGGHLAPRVISVWEKKPSTSTKMLYL